MSQPLPVLTLGRDVANLIYFTNRTVGIHGSVLDFSRNLSPEALHSEAVTGGPPYAVECKLSQRAIGMFDRALHPMLRGVKCVFITYVLPASVVGVTGFGPGTYSFVQGDPFVVCSAEVEVVDRVQSPGVPYLFRERATGTTANDPVLLAFKAWLDGGLGVPRDSTEVVQQYRDHVHESHCSGAEESNETN
jgi:hypothetical protein